MMRENVMDIPKTFELMGQTINVRFVSELLQESDTLGQACYRTGEIKILESSPTYIVTEERQMQTFLHELMHWIFYKLNKDDLCKDEDLVEKKPFDAIGEDEGRQRVRARIQLDDEENEEELLGAATLQKLADSRREDEEPAAEAEVIDVEPAKKPVKDAVVEVDEVSEDDLEDEDLEDEDEEE